MVRSRHTVPEGGNRPPSSTRIRPARILSSHVVGVAGACHHAPDGLEIPGAFDDAW